MQTVSKARTFHVRTYGCQMNVRDSEAVSCLLEEHGFQRADHEEGADVLLFNTCSVRDQAERKVLGKVGLLKRLKRERPGMVVGIIGCMAQNHGAGLVERLPHVDLVVGTDQIHHLPHLVDEVLAGRRGLVSTETSSEGGVALRGHEPGRVSAYVSVMRGCDQFCSYCVVPYVRGREKSRTVEDIVAEIEQLASQGTREIVLLGQNITAYGVAEARRAGRYTPDLSPFADLLRAVSRVPGVIRIRFTSPHPRYMNRAFVDAVCELPNVCKAFHIPLQSGSDRLLKMMRRGYTVAEYLTVVRQVRERAPGATFSTDVIVGFPTETDDDFAATRRAMGEAQFDMAYIFKYSPRRGTLAADKYPDDVPKAVKEERNRALLDDLERSVEDRNRRYVGQTLEVLVEGPSAQNPRRWTGRSDGSKVCIFEPTPGVVPGGLAVVRVARTTSHSLFGDVV